MAGFDGQVTRDGMVHLAFHPMTQRLLLAAGDKSGHVGLWKADHPSLGKEPFMTSGICRTELPFPSKYVLLLSEFHASGPCLRGYAAGLAQVG